jgi:hypothetical protein
LDLVFDVDLFGQFDSDSPPNEFLTLQEIVQDVFTAFDENSDESSTEVGNRSYLQQKAR